MDGISAGFRGLFAELAGFGGWRLGRSVILAAVAAGLEGIGLVLLLPLLAAAGVAEGGTSPVVSRLAGSWSLSELLVLWLAVVVALAWFTARRETAQARLNRDFVHHLRLRLHAALLGMEWAEFQRLRSSDVVSALTVGAARVGLGVSNLVQGLAGLLLILLHAVIALSLSPPAAGLALAAGLGLALVQFPRLRRMSRHGAAVDDGLRGVHAVIGEHVAAMKLARSHNAEAAFAAAFEREVVRLGEGQAAGIGDMAAGRARQRMAAAMVLAGMVWLSVEHLETGGAALLLLLAVFARLLPAIGQVVQSAQRVAEMLPAHDDIESLRRRAIAAAAAPAAAGLAPPAGPLRLRGVGYTWPGRRHPALRGIDLDIAENRTTALVGPSGAGKSTLADLCLGLLAPDAGTVTVGGEALAGALGPAWRRRCAVVPQEVVLFHDTVRANLAWACPEADDAGLWRALDAAAAADVVRALPLGLDTVVGDRGTRLSGGERQRLALARALLRRPAVLVLDEATSHLDGGNERLIRDSLDRLHGSLTVLVIAHRLGTVRHADSIAVIEDGRLREQGGWDELMAAGGWLAAAARRTGEG